MNTARRRLRRLLLATIPALLLAACGGGGGDAGAPPVTDCSVAGQKDWLRGYMDDWYFWYRLSPSPDPAPFAGVDDYFKALLYGGDSTFPRDRWSFSQSTESFNRFFGDGQTLGYGIFVAGLEVSGRPDLPLFVRYVEALSDAAVHGVQRGDEVLTVNGRAVSELIRANDFSLLTPSAAGERLVLRLRNGGIERSVTLAAAVYPLSPVTAPTLLATPAGRRMGYVLVKDMISQLNAPLDAAFAQFKSAGVQELVLDLRYNGGGLVQVASDVASFVTGARAQGQLFASLLYNDKRAAERNQRFLLGDPASAVGLSRVYILAGERTCSASEQVINGLRPYVDVVLIGDTTCGKPVGFLPASQCGITYSAVNFESVNARNEGRYFDGLVPTCVVVEDFTRPLGAVDEPLLAAARRHADSGSCVLPGAVRSSAQARGQGSRRHDDAGEARGMIVR